MNNTSFLNENIQALNVTLTTYLFSFGVGESGGLLAPKP